MNDFLQQLIGMGPGIGAAAGGNGPAFASFMRGYQRTMAGLDQKKRLQQQDSLAMEDRQNQMSRQQAQDARAAEDQTWQNEQRRLATAGALSQAASGAESVPEGEAAIDTLFRVLSPQMQSTLAPARDAALSGVQRNVSSRQKAELKRWVSDELMKSRFIAENADSDPDVTQAMPARIRQLAQQVTGKTELRKSDLLSLAEVMEQAPPKPAPSPAFNLSPGQTRFGGDGKPIASLPDRPKPAGDGTPEQIFVVRNGAVIPITKGTAQPGDVPYSARTQNDSRPVTSGDAADIAEFNTALDDVTTLRDTLKGIKATGTSAAIGAAVPNAVTEATGWGTEAKQKNAVIARVKQVIGKALEGGVLRKEDESKYAKILPTISDTPEVVATKLDGLEKAIRQRQQNKLDALTDAGYDVSRFAKRGGAAPAPATPAATAPAGGPKAGERRRSPNGDLVEFDGKGWFVVRP